MQIADVFIENEQDVCEFTEGMEELISNVINKVLEQENFTNELKFYSSADNSWAENGKVEITQDKKLKALSTVKPISTKLVLL